MGVIPWGGRFWFWLRFCVRLARLKCRCYCQRDYTRSSKVERLWRGGIHVMGKAERWAAHQIGMGRRGGCTYCWGWGPPRWYWCWFCCLFGWPFEAWNIRDPPPRLLGKGGWMKIYEPLGKSIFNLLYCLSKDRPLENPTFTITQDSPNHPTKTCSWVAHLTRCKCRGCWRLRPRHRQGSLGVAREGSSVQLKWVKREQRRWVQWICTA